MALPDHDRRALIPIVARRTGRIVASLRELDPDDLLAPSQLPGWSRLTIACHLRYGAEASARMTSAALVGDPAAFYPEGRSHQRPSTLFPRSGEPPGAVIDSLAHRSGLLEALWSGLDEAAWRLDVVEPQDNPDLGTVDVERLLLLRLTEVEVHGCDLGLGLPDWDEQFVRFVLRMRLAWLNTRWTNHRQADDELEGSWLLVGSTAPAYRITLEHSVVESAPAPRGDPARSVIEGTNRDLLALLLGRPTIEPLRITGDLAFGEAFTAVFPGP
jgi:uncharacterized protein (TIGR03083 family)